jgi:tetratricopeptide (TPR) repeat protein
MMQKKAAVSNIVKRKSRLIPRLVITVCFVLVIGVLSFSLYIFLNSPAHNAFSVRSLYKQWLKYDYQGVYNTSNRILGVKPFNNTALMFKGYSGFYLAVSQTDPTKARDYLDEAIFSMRVAMQNSKQRMKPQLNYMLGKSYFYKNTLSSYYYYADLAIKYLAAAQKEGYRADDISEYMGLSYAALGMTMESISAFTEALLVRESDTLLLSIAEQYYKIGQAAAAEQYLYRVMTRSKDSDLILRSRLLLGKIYTDEGKLNDATTEFTTILEKNENSADACYGLGVIYEKEGDLIKARAEWRKALHIQVNHPDALKKMAEYNK